MHVPCRPPTCGTLPCRRLLLNTYIVQFGICKCQAYGRFGSRTCIAHPWHHLRHLNSRFGPECQGSLSVSMPSLRHSAYTFGTTGTLVLHGKFEHVRTLICVQPTSSVILAATSEPRCYNNGHTRPPLRVIETRTRQPSFSRLTSCRSTVPKPPPIQASPSPVTSANPLASANHLHAARKAAYKPRHVEIFTPSK